MCQQTEPGEQAVTSGASERGVHLLAGGTSHRAFLLCKLLLEFHLVIGRVTSEFSQLVFVRGRWGSFACKRDWVCSTGRCSVYLPKAKCGGKRKGDKKFVLCVLHLCCMRQVEPKLGLSISRPRGV